MTQNIQQSFDVMDINFVI